MNDVRATMAKGDIKKKPMVEEAIDKYCKKKELGAKEKKLCYYIEPVKRDIAQPFSTGMPTEKLCKRIAKANPEVCSVRFPAKTEGKTEDDFKGMRVKQLKQILADRGVECKGCSEKGEFVKKVVATQHMEM
jgi:hypothetical protein